METVQRPAARILCLDHQRRVLLLRWRDPVAGRYIWEPPGGGIEPGEQAVDAARRELQEETGLPPAGITDRHVMVHRDVHWNGKHFVGEEAFFLAWFDRPGDLDPDGLEQRESESLYGYVWAHWDDVDRLPDAVEPPNLVAILRALHPAGRLR